MKNKKGTKIKGVLDEKSGFLKLNGFIVLEDTWIGKDDKFLYNQNNEKFEILGFYILEQEKLPNPLIRYLKPRKEKFSCVLLDKKINIGDILYIK